MVNQYIGWTLQELRVERRKVQDLLSHGSITRLAENGQDTQFSRVDLERRLQFIYDAIAEDDNATDAEVAAASNQRPGITRPNFCV